LGERRLFRLLILVELLTVAV